MQPENIYCGYCSRLIDVSLPDNNLSCAGCEGYFHLECTSLSESPKEQQHLKWKCTNCVRTEPLQEDVGGVLDAMPIEFHSEDLRDRIERRLETLQKVFCKDIQILYARVSTTEYERNDREECLVVNGIPCGASESLIEMVKELGAAKGMYLKPQQVFRCAPESSRLLCSFVVKFDSSVKRQKLLNTYLSSIMKPIVVEPRPKWTLGDDEKVGDSLLPQTTTVASTINSTSPLYMYEFLSPQSQTMLVKSVSSEDPKMNGRVGRALDAGTVVVHDESTNVNIIPVIKISSAPLIRLASKESFDDFEDNNNNNLPPIQSSASIVSIVSSASVSGSEPSDGHSESQIIPADLQREQKIIPHEKWWQTTLQISIPFFLAGIGTVGAGIILGNVEHWDVFKHISELFILVPSLLGLKGNLDMCLASRLSTQANLGNMTSKKVILKMIIGNIALVQVQATVAAFTVALFAISMGQLMNQSFDFAHTMVIIASAMFTATSSCFVLDFFLIAMVLTSIKLKMNPDNLATPLAASIGDVVSISVFSFIASLLYKFHETHLWATFVVVAIYFTLLPVWILVVLKNEYTRPVLRSGWVPVMSALFISGLGGLVLDKSIDIFNGFVVFQPIINGIGGNLVSVQASKISTMLHQSSILGIVPPYTKIVERPFKALFSGVPYAKTGRILVLMTIPALLFIFVADLIHANEITIDIFFTLVYWVVSVVQVCLLLYTAHVIIHFMWKNKIDPDNSAIPYLTALGDLSGSCLLFIAFYFLNVIGHGYLDDPETGN